MCIKPKKKKKKSWNKRSGAPSFMPSFTFKIFLSKMMTLCTITSSMPYKILMMTEDIVFRYVANIVLPNYHPKFLTLSKLCGFGDQPVYTKSLFNILAIIEIDPSYQAKFIHKTVYLLKWTSKSIFSEINTKKINQ